MTTTTKPLDENDRHLAGTLPPDPIDDTEPMRSDTGVAKVTLRLAGEGDAPTPNDLPAESALLAAILWAGTHVQSGITPNTVRDLIDRPDMFALPTYRAIWQACCAVQVEGKPLDAVAVHTELARERRGARVALQTLEDLVDVATSTSESKARAYAQSIRDCWVRRELISATRKMVVAANDLETAPADAVQNAHVLLTELQEATANDASFVSLGKCFPDLIREMRNGMPDTFKTGLRDLDEATGGLFLKETSIIAARTSVGKSALAAQICHHIVATNTGAAVLYASLEMPAASFAKRLAANAAGVDARKIRRQTVTPDEASRIFREVEALYRLPMFFLDKQQQTLMSIYASATKLATKLAREGKRIAAIVIDHIGLVKPSASAGAKRNREQEVAETSRGLRWLASEFNCHVLGLAQINREASKRKGKDSMPQLHDLRESGSLENDADNIFILHRDFDENGVPIPGLPAKLAVAKARNDNRDFMHLNFEPQYVRFTDWNG